MKNIYSGVTVVLFTFLCNFCFANRNIAPPCTLPAPVVGTVTVGTCDGVVFGAIALSGLPETNWILYILRNGVEYSSISGTGPTYTIHDMRAGSTYTISVTDTMLGCTSATVSAFVPYDQCWFNFSMDGTYEDLNNDGVASAGDVIHCTAVFVNDLGSGVSNIEVTESFSPSAVWWLYYSPLNIIIPPFSSANFTYTHVVTQQEINLGFSHCEAQAYIQWGGTNIETRYTVKDFPLSVGDGLKLNAFIDANGNGVRDFGEANFSHGTFHSEHNNDGIIHDIVTQAGSYVIQENNASATYDISLSVDSDYSAQYAVTTPAVNGLTVAAGSGITTVDFPVSAIPFYDVSVALHRFDVPRPGFIYKNYITFTNNGNAIIPTGTISFTKDPLYAITQMPMYSSATAEGFVHTFSYLYPNETRTIIVGMQVPVIPSVNLGDFITTGISAGIPQTDAVPVNNNDELTEIIVGSLDPNDKSESHGGKIEVSEFTTNDYLTYTIRFENTGTANALNIRVEDLLDDQLDETSVRMVAASHSYVMERTGKQLVWKFEANLPPATPANENGHGYIMFQVKPKPGYGIGNIIPNLANIYLDFNPAITTNVCTSEFVSTLALHEFKTADFSVYPNPTQSKLTVSDGKTTINEATITNIAGQIIISNAVNNTSAVMDLSQLSSGIYFLNVKSDAGEQTFKVLKD